MVPPTTITLLALVIMLSTTASQFLFYKNFQNIIRHNLERSEPPLQSSEYKINLRAGGYARHQRSRVNNLFR